MAVTAANLKTAYDAIIALSTSTYWVHEMLTDSGDISVPDALEYYTLYDPIDPSVRDFSGEAYSSTILHVTAWAATRGNEIALLASAVTALEAIGWRVIDRRRVPSARRRYGLLGVLKKEH